MNPVFGGRLQNHVHHRQLHFSGFMFKTFEIALQVLLKITIQLLESVVCSSWHRVPLALSAFWMGIP
jgi:hypothetical protein